MIRPRSPHHIEQVADFFLGREAPAPGPSPAPARRLPDPPRVATVAADETAARFERQLARAAGDWSALGPLAEAAELSDPRRPCPCPLDALICLVGRHDPLPPPLAAGLARLAASCRARRVIVLLILPVRTDPREARRLSEAAKAALGAGLDRPLAMLCVREEDLRGNSARTPAVLGAVLLAIRRRGGP